MRNGKIWRPNGRTIVSETLKYQRERGTLGHSTSKHATTAKPDTSKLQDLTLKGTELGERNCKTTRTKTAKIKQMYEVEQSTYAKLKAAKKGFERKNIS